MELEEHALNKHDTANIHRQEEQDETDSICFLTEENPRSRLKRMNTSDVSFTNNSALSGEHRESTHV